MLDNNPPETNAEIIISRARVERATNHLIERDVLVVMPVGLCDNHAAQDFVLNMMQAIYKEPTDIISKKITLADEGMTVRIMDTTLQQTRVRIELVPEPELKRTLSQHARKGTVLVSSNTEIIFDKHEHHYHMITPEERAQAKKARLEAARFWELPGENPDFIGRKEELIELEQQLIKDKKSIIGQSLVGLGGVGKTQVALAYARQHQAISMDSITSSQNDELTKPSYQAIIWFRASALSSETMNLGRDLNIDTKETEGRELVKRICEQLAELGSRVLLVFDDVRDEEVLADWEQVVAAFHSNPHSDIIFHLLATSRNQHWVKWRKLPLGVFTRRDARDFVQKRVSVASEGEANKLALLVHYFPLALSQAVAYIIKHNQKITAYCQQYEAYTKAKQSLLTQDLSTDWGIKIDNAKRSVYTTLSMSVKEIARDYPLAVTILNLCAFLASDNIPYFLLGGKDSVESNATGLLLDLSYDEWQEVIKQLRSYSLADFYHETRFDKDTWRLQFPHLEVHNMVQDIIRLYLRQQPMAEDDSSSHIQAFQEHCTQDTDKRGGQGYEKCFDYYGNYILRLLAQPFGCDDAEEENEQVRHTLFPHREAIADLAKYNGWDSSTSRTLYSVIGDYQTQLVKNHSQARVWFDQALKLSECTQDNLEETAKILTGLAETMMHCGYKDEARNQVKQIRSKLDLLSHPLQHKLRNRLIALLPFLNGSPDDLKQLSLQKPANSDESTTPSSYGSQASPVMFRRKNDTKPAGKIDNWVEQVREVIHRDDKIALQRLADEKSDDDVLFGKYALTRSHQYSNVLSVACKFSALDCIHWIYYRLSDRPHLWQSLVETKGGPMDTTPLYVAVSWYKRQLNQRNEDKAFEIIEFLLAKGKANPNSENGQFNQTALHQAAQYGLRRVVNLLIAHGANPLQQQSLKRYPYHLVQRGNTQVRSQLIFHVQKERDQRLDVLLEGKSEKFHALVQSIKDGDNEQFREILIKDPELVAGPILGEHSLAALVLMHGECEHTAVFIQICIEKRCDFGPSVRLTKSNDTALHLAIRNAPEDCTAIARKLVEKWPILTYTDNDFGHKPLYEAVLFARREVIDLILDRNPEMLFDHNNVSDFTMLILAVWADHIATAKHILGKAKKSTYFSSPAKADEHDKREFGNLEAYLGYECSTSQLSALRIACRNGNRAICQMLLEEGVDPAQKTSDIEWTSLHDVAEQGNLELFELLLSHCHIDDSFLEDWQDDIKRTPLDVVPYEHQRTFLIAFLHAAIRQQAVSVVRYAFRKMEHDNDLIAELDNVGRSALWLACDKGSYDICKVLLEKGASPTQNTGEDQQSALHCAAKRGDVILFKLMFGYVADYNFLASCQDRDGKTPLDVVPEGITQAFHKVVHGESESSNFFDNIAGFFTPYPIRRKNWVSQRYSQPGNDLSHTLS